MIYQHPVVLTPEAAEASQRLIARLRADNEHLRVQVAELAHRLNQKRARQATTKAGA